MVGCCAHVASVLWYLGYQKHVIQEVKPDRTDYNDFILDAISTISNWSESDETEGESELN